MWIFIIGLMVAYLIYQSAKKSLLSRATCKQRRAETLRAENVQHNNLDIINHQFEQPNYMDNKSRMARWYGYGQGVVIHSHKIADGLIYVGQLLLTDYGFGNDACLINPKLKICSFDSQGGEESIGYWPKYSDLSERCRGAYLQWLADGRFDPKVDIGFVFLFFYGLERRLFRDGQQGKVSTAEREDIVREVNRLLKIYGENRSFRGYAKRLLAMEWVFYQRDKSVPDYIDFNDRYCPEPFQVVLAQHVMTQKPIPGEIALQWLMLHPELKLLRTPARRCPNEFKALFTFRYQQQFGEGIIVKPNKKILEVNYVPANPSINRNLTLKINELPNPFILTSPLKKLSRLVENCLTDLEPYSRCIGRKDLDSTSFIVLSLLPNILMERVPIVQSIKSRFITVCAGEYKLLLLPDLYQYLGAKLPSRFGKKELESIANFMEKIGFGLVPDVRFHNIKVTIDEKILIFQNENVRNFKPSVGFNQMVIILFLGAIITQADQNIAPEQEATLQKAIRDNKKLTIIERDFLMAFLYWSLRNPLNMTKLRQKISELQVREKTAIGNFLVEVAQADGRIDPREVKQMEKLYTLLGLDKQQVIARLHTFAAAKEPVTMRLGDKENIFFIPPSPSAVSTNSFHLDEELVKIREEETQRVKNVLESIFIDSSEIVIADNSANTVTSVNPLTSLDIAYQNFLHELLKQEVWEKNVLYDVCKKSGLMLDGAMEVLNEWAFEHANAPLLDDGDPIYVDVALAKEIINAE